MGADRGIHVTTDMAIDQALQPLAVAKVFEHIMTRDKFEMLLLGKQAIDDDYVQTGQIIGSRMGIPTASFSSEITFNEDASQADILREVDFGL